MLNAIKNKFLYFVLPKIVDFLTTISAQKAARRLKAENAKTLLVDNTVIGHSITHETAWVDTGKSNWGDEEIDTGYMARIPVHADEDEGEAATSVRYLPGIIELAKRKIISFATSLELEDEQLTQPVGRFQGYGLYDLSILRGVKFKTIDDPDYKVAFGSDELSVNDQRKERLRKKLGEDPLYKSLVSVLGPKNSQDAWHIATAEHNGCYCFLTMDFKLMRNIRAQANNKVIKSLKTRIMTPEDFGKEFKICPISPRLFSYHAASYFVEHDKNWPDSKRQKPHNRNHH